MNTEASALMARTTDPPPAERSVYCLFCKTGREQEIVRALALRDIACMIAYSSRIVVRNGKEIVEKRRLLPGYVFLETEQRLSPGVAFLQSNPDCLRLLGYEYGEYALRGSDLAFYQWLKKRGGMVEISRVYREGDLIRVLDGPLKAFEGRIVAVNKKRKCVAISLGENSLMNKIWCSIEYIERAE